MALHKGSFDIGHRMAEELLRMFPDESIRGICKKLGADRRAIADWERGNTPTTVFLQRLHYLGGDVMYVLTGHRYALVKTVMVHSMGGTRRMKWNGETLEEDL